MQGRRYPFWRDCKALLLAALTLIVLPHDGLLAGERTPDNTSPRAGRRLILIYGDRRVDLRTPEGAETDAASPDTPAAAAPLDMPDALGGSASDDSKLPPSRLRFDRPRQDEEEIPEHPGGANHDSQLRTNLLRSATAPSWSDSPPPPPAVNLEPNVSLELDTAWPPAPAVSDPVSLDSPPTVVPRADPIEILSSPGAERTVEADQSTSPLGWSIQWLEQRLAVLVVVLLGAVVCLILVVIQLLLTVRKFSGKLVPTIRLEMGNTGLVAPYFTAGYVRDDESDRPRNPHGARGGAVADLADATIPFELLSGTYEQQRQAEQARKQEQEQAILKEIFEDNIALREQIRTRAV